MTLMEYCDILLDLGCHSRTDISFLYRISNINELKILNLYSFIILCHKKTCFLCTHDGCVLKDLLHPVYRIIVLMFLFIPIVDHYLFS
jgi:hypothetical protein